MTLLPILILFLAAACVYAAEANQPEPSPPTPPEPQVAPPPDAPDKPRLMLDENYVNQILEELKQTDPNQAQKLENLRQENPRLFQVEIRKLAWEQHKMAQEGPEAGHIHRGQAMQGSPGENGPMGPRGMDRGHERLHEMETEFLSWLAKNEPNDANQLAGLKDKDPLAYARRLAVEMKKYRPIIEAERTNPALADLLKKNIGLKEKRNALLEKIKGTTDEKQKKDLTAQLKEVIGDQFDVIIQKKQLQYEDLKKRLDELQKEVNTSQSDLDNYKKNKEDLIKKHLDDLINKSGQFDWD